MELTYFLKYTWIPFVAVFWWENRNMRARIEKLSKEISDHKLHVAETYVNHAELADIKALLRRIDDKLDNKADK